MALVFLKIFFSFQISLRALPRQSRPAQTLPKDAKLGLAADAARSHESRIFEHDGSELSNAAFQSELCPIPEPNVQQSDEQRRNVQQQSDDDDAPKFFSPTDDDAPTKVSPNEATPNDDAAKGHVPGTARIPCGVSARISTTWISASIPATWISARVPAAGISTAIFPWNASSPNTCHDGGSAASVGATAGAATHLCPTSADTAATTAYVSKR